MRYRSIILTFLLIASVVSDCGSQNYSNVFFEVMDGCNDVYDSDAKIEFLLTSHSVQILQWLDWPVLLQYILFASMIVGPIWQYTTEEEYGISSEGAARTQRLRLQLLNLLFRTALGVSISVWMKVAINQERPCFCNFVSDSPMGAWGMPSTTVVASTIVAFHLLERASAFAGVLILMLVPTSQVLLGLYSIGQVLVGLAVGMVVHFYGSRTAFAMRFADFFVNLLTGLLVFFLMKPSYKNVDFDFTADFYRGVAWQLVTLMIILLTHDWTFIKTIVSKSTYSLDITDFLYYVPLNESTEERDPKKRKDTMVALIAVVVLFFLLGGCSMIQPHLNGWYDR